MEKEIAQLCQILKAHSIRLVYTPDDWPAWKPWQIIASHQDGRFQHFKICKTAEEAIRTALEQAQSKPPALLNIPASWERWPKGTGIATEAEKEADREAEREELWQPGDEPYEPDYWGAHYE